MNRSSDESELPDKRQIGEYDPVAVLVDYDERLRSGGVGIIGGSPSVAIGAVCEGESATQNVESPAPPEELAECLRLIEEVWPRGRAREPDLIFPTRIGRFEVLRLLGSGGFGIVYLAQDPLLNRRVALKVPRLHALASAGLRERFRREARATAALDHPHIVPIHETGEAGPLCYIAFAYCDGPSLAQWRKLQQGDVPVRVAAGIVQYLAEAMHYSHSRGIQHRDLKPSNVLLFPSPLEARNGGESLAFTPRIVDFGLASLVEDEVEATGTSAIIGTPLYMAPEQALGMEQIGAAADLYALGVILYELLCGRPPFIGTAPLEVLDQVRRAEPPRIRKWRKDVPTDLETICLRCLQKRPEDRYQTARGLAEDLQRFLEKQPIVARPVSSLVSVYRWCQQPQRIREAGLTVVRVNLAIGANMFVTLLMVQAGIVLERPADFSVAGWYPPALAIIFGIHVPSSLLGRLVIAGRAWALWLALVSGAAMAVLATLFLLGFVPRGVSLWDEVPGYRIVYPLMTVLFVWQTIICGIATISLKTRQGQQIRPRRGTIENSNPSSATES